MSVETEGYMDSFLVCLYGSVDNNNNKNNNIKNNNNYYYYYQKNIYKIICTERSIRIEKITENLNILCIKTKKTIN